MSDPTGRGSSAWVTAIRRRVFPAPTMKLLAMTMADYVNGDDECWPGNALLGVELGITERQVQSLLSRLETLGVLERGEARREKGRRGRPRTAWVLRYEGLSRLALATRAFPEESSGKSRELPEVAEGITGSPSTDLPEVCDTPSSFKNPPLEEPPKRTSEDDFARFYAVYPLHRGPAAARTAFAKAVKAINGDVERIIAGAIRYRDDPNRDPSYTCLPATWLNQERWDDDPLPPRPHPNGRAPSAVDVDLGRPFPKWG